MTSSYDDAGRLRTVTSPAGKRITYSLDAISRRTVMVEPGGGRFSYSYDDADRITQLINTQSLRTSWVYDNADRTTSKRLANTDRTSFTYDDADQILRVANVIPGVTTISSFAYKYDSAGNRLRVVEANGDTVTWSYDNTYQLTNEKRSGTNSYNVTYLYDPAGNRLRKNDSGTLTTSTYDAANQLIKQNAAGTVTTYTFDANGNQQRTSSSIVTTYTWDFENRLTKIRPSNLLPAINTLTYDGDGKRVRKDDSSGTVKHIWDGANILEETDQNDLTKSIYTLIPAVYGSVISELRGSTTSFYNFDGLGSTDRLTDTTGQTVTDSYVYKAFGDLQTSTGMTINPFRYVGEKGYYYDLDFLDYTLRARIYSPSIGRFLSRDKFLVRNLFVYVGNRPVIAVDPSGNVCANINQKSCCCCAESLKLAEQPKKYPQQTKPDKPLPANVFGHVFKLEAKLSFKVAEKNSFCDLRWLEKSNLVPKFYPGYCKPYEWCSLYLGAGKTAAAFQNWVKVEKDPPCPGMSTILMSDSPGIAKELLFTIRCFWIRINSTCPKEKKMCDKEFVEIFLYQGLQTDDFGGILTQYFSESKCPWDGSTGRK